MAALSLSAAGDARRLMHAAELRAYASSKAGRELGPRWCSRATGTKTALWKVWEEKLERPPEPVVLLLLLELALDLTQPDFEGELRTAINLYAPAFSRVDLVGARHWAQQLLGQELDAQTCAAWAGVGRRTWRRWDEGERQKKIIPTSAARAFMMGAYLSYRSGRRFDPQAVEVLEALGRLRAATAATPS